MRLPIKALVDSCGLLLTGEVEKWTLIPSHYKLLSSFVTVTIFQGESLRPDSQTKTHLFLTSRTQLGGWREVRLSIFSAGIIKDTKLAGHVHQSVVDCQPAIYVCTLLHQISGTGQPGAALIQSLKLKLPSPCSWLSIIKGYIITLQFEKSNLK